MRYAAFIFINFRSITNIQMFKIETKVELISAIFTLVKHQR